MTLCLLQGGFVDEGRFISEDPLRFAAGVDFYDYVYNRPLILVDPTGLDSDCGALVPQGLCDWLKGRKTPVWKECRCTRVRSTPTTFGLGPGAKRCEYTCPGCGGGILIAAINSIRSLPGCKDTQTCPYQISAEFETSSGSRVILPVSPPPPIMNPPPTP